MIDGEPKSWDNQYFNGSIRSVNTAVDGRRATEGEINPGEYIIPTGDEEHITVLSGMLNVKLPGTDAFWPYYPGQIFVVHAHSKFTVTCTELVTYRCVYFEPDAEGGY